MATDTKTAVKVIKGSCTTLDHVYPVNPWKDRVLDGTPCFCGARKWNDRQMRTGRVSTAVDKK